MLTTIIKREFIAHIHSLRLSLALVLCVSLMALNALCLVYSAYQFERDIYRENVARQYQDLRDKGTAGLWMMALKGPGPLYKRPSDLSFCAGFSDNKLPNRVDTIAQHKSWISRGAFYNLHWPWVISFSTELENVALLSSSITIDWVFIIGVLLGLTALLFTYDALIGEKENGTLKLVMANPLPRHTMLLGKFCGAMMVLIGVLLLSITLNLLIVLILADLSLNFSHVVRIAAMVFISVVYLAGCTSLGLLISAHSSSRRGSLTTVLFAWVSMVLLWPQMGKTIAELFYEDLQALEHDRRGYSPFNPVPPPIMEKVFDLVLEKSKGRWRDPVFLGELSDALRSEQTHHQKLENAVLSQRLQQVDLAQNIVRLSPMGSYQYAMEAMAGTGIARYKYFIDQVRTYAQHFEENLLSIDRADPRSLHIPLVANGLSTQKIKLDQVSVFKEDFSATSLAGPVVVDLVALGFFAVFTYLVAYLFWLRCSIAN